MPIDRRAPDLDKETPADASVDLVTGIELGLSSRHGVDLAIEGRVGNDAAVFVAIMRGASDVDIARKAHEIFVFARGAASSDRAIDALDGIVADIKKRGGPDQGRFLPLDWEGRPYGDDVVFVRGEVRDYVAEEEAAKLLEEPAPPRGLRRAVVH